MRWRTVCWALGLRAVLGLSQTASTFTQTGNLTIPRAFHTATLLPNGKVLIAGGVAIEEVPISRWASAEIYDPSTGSFTQTSDMTIPRQCHTATLLPSGQVLIAGGGLNCGGGSSAELYDPVSGTFQATGNMIASRGRHTATLLNSGKVLVVGGWYPPNASGAPTYQPAEVFDPATGTFAATADLMDSTADRATLLPNGKVLIAAGIFGGGAHAYLYDPKTGTFTRTSGLAELQLGASPAGALLANGKVLLAGGDLEDLGGSSNAGIYDPVTDVASSVGKMTVTMLFATATLLPEGKVLVAGGDDETRCSNDPNHCFVPPATPVGTAELYDPAIGTFTRAGSSQSEQGHAATLLPDGTVLLSGGEIFGCCYATAEIYQPALLAPSPVLYSVSGNRQGAILHGSTQQLVSPDNPAMDGEAIEIYGAGLIDGAVVPPQVAIGGRSAEVLYFGAAPGYSGLSQINVRVPSGIDPGSAVPVRLDYLSRPSNQVTMAVR